MAKFFHVLLLLACCTRAQWVQDRFIIGSWWDPRFNGNAAQDEARLVTFRNANFNTLLGISPSMPGTFPEILPNDFNTSATSNRYRLERVAAVPGLRMFIADDRYYGVGLAYNSATMQNVLADYLSLPQNLRDVMQGYHVADEPWYINPNQLPNEVSKIQHLIAGDPERVSWANLYSNRVGPTMFFGSSNEPNYVNYVRDYLASGSRAVSFDNYCFTTNGTVVRIRDRFFRNNQIVAELARSSGVSFWGFPMSVNHHNNTSGAVTMDHDGPADYRILNEARMRFMAYVPVLYGAKGIVWHTYEPPCRQATGCNVNDGWIYQNRALVNLDGTPNTSTANGNAPLYTWAQTINRNLLNMGSTLMQMRWLGTFHGSSTNIMATSTNQPTFNGPPETDLPVVTATNELIEVNGIAPAAANFAIGLFEGRPPFQYLLVMNKDLATQRTVTITLKPTIRAIARHNRTTDSWTALSLPSTGPATATLTIAPGDMHLIRLDKSKIRKYARAANSN